MVFTLLALLAVLAVLLFNGGGSSDASRFDLSTVPTSQSVQSGNSTTYQVVLTARGTFRGDIALSTSSLPTGVTAEFSRPTITLSSAIRTGSVSLTFTTGAGAAPGPDVVGVMARSGRAMTSANLILQIQSVGVR